MKRLALLGCFIIEEASCDGLMSGVELQRLLGTQGVIFDRLLAAIGEEHGARPRCAWSPPGKGRLSG